MPSIEDWDLPRKRKLVEALLACDCMQTPLSRDQIIDELPPEIGHRYDRQTERSEMEFQTEFTFDKKTVPATP
jgi:hypothetical protein